MNQYSKYTDLKDLYHKVVPAIGKFDKRIQNFMNEFEQCKQIIERMDEIVNHKANKLVVDDILTKIRSFATYEQMKNQKFDLEIMN